MTTYARRHTRSRRFSPDASNTSPIRPLSPDAEDISFVIMAERMNKRARLAPSSSKDDLGPGQGEHRPLKRTKSYTSDSQQLQPFVDDLQGDYMLDGFARTGFQMSTPFQARPSDHCMTASSVGRAPALPEQLSPLPVAKRIISRTGSRNFRENAGQRVSRSLASPFSSRPGSRAASPDKLARNRRGMHAKSRTLSQSGALKEKFMDHNTVVSVPSANVMPSFGGPTSTVAQDTPSKKGDLAHARASSIPTLKLPADHLGFEHWLVAPKGIARDPGTADSARLRVQEHAIDADMEHTSFFRDVPVQISTPPRSQRSATVGIWAHGLMPQIEADPPPPVRSFRYDSDVDMTDSSCPGSPSDFRSSRVHNPSRRRRRTIVHMPSDSLFSSSLDFSALMSETERLPRPPASEGSRSPVLSDHVRNSDLGPAFSLHSSPVAQSHKFDSDLGGSSALPGSSGPGLSSPSAVASDRDNARLAPPLQSLDPGHLATVNLDVDGDELLGLFSVLGLDEDEKWTMDSGADDSGIFLSQAEAQSSLPSSKGGRVRRKRGDTIRASDFPKVPMSASFDGSTGIAGLSGPPRVPPRRTRSGTVTQASSSGSGGSGSCSASGSRRRKHEGWPTIKMRTTEEPLRVDGDDADDELLLKDGDVVD
ncbi:hypothetical protein BN946_scf184851.g34 [Trametes cinnabarina]|uniref:Uncharacterized protein n=1 Tax=Pycnoporus cinnabarinus TaxID=5643 RepID=A0A060S602_PYCCI|nr:hypothetical protein BN946_scf184851.g34 [Trametes cinnabarina]